MKTSLKSTARKSTTKQTAAVKRHRLNPEMFIVPAVESNPRRKKSFGYKSMSIILNSRKPQTVETFIDKGGRLRDLHWDIEAGHVKLMKKAG